MSALHIPRPFGASQAGEAVVNDFDILNANILVVDDQEDHAYALKALLHASGYLNVETTTDPRLVSQLYLEHHFSLILLDLEMPGMNGFRVMEELKRLGSDDYLPIFVVSGATNLKLPALMAGAKDFISKPFDAGEALARVRNMLEVRLLLAAAVHTAEDLNVLALHDPLTGLGNRRLLSDRLSAAMSNARRNNAEMGLIYLDLDGFKNVNDSFGHAVGDTLLKIAADRLLSHVRKEDTVVRSAGDEFVIVLWHVRGVDDAVVAANKLVRALSEPYQLGKHSAAVTVSAGIGVFPLHGLDAETLLRSADAALYSAKQLGGNMCRISCEEIFPRSDNP